MVELYTGGLYWEGGGGGLYVYGNCLIAMGIEWFEPDISGLAKLAKHLTCSLVCMSCEI